MTKPIIPSEVLTELARFDSPTVSNAIEHFKVRDPVTGYATSELRCQFPEYKPMVGYAVTCTADSSTPGDDRPLRLEELIDAIEAAPKPCILVVQQVGSKRLRSCFVGDIVCAALETLGGVGFVTDAAYRDQSGIARRTPGFQIFASGRVVSHGHCAFLDFNVPVSICGLDIEPGDILHGDESGLLKIPYNITQTLAKQCQMARDAEAKYFEAMKSSDLTCEEIKKRLGIH